MILLSCVTLFDNKGSQAGNVSTCQDKLVDVFHRIEHFFQWLEIYTSITPTTAMMDLVVESMVEVLTILVVTSKEAKYGRLSVSISRRFTILDSYLIQESILRS